jgi:mono/diheme cytochrome c family protein
VSPIRRVLRITGIVLGAFALVIVGVLVYVGLRWDARFERRVPELTAPHDQAAIARGEFLYKASLTCWQCHSTGREANAPPTGGRRFDLTTLNPSLGVYYAPNITPDVETGIGGWTDGEIVRAIREGIRKDGRVLFPIMPVDPLHGLSDTDALALVAYLRTIPPVKNVVAARQPSLFVKTLFTFGVVGPMKEISEPVVAPARALTAEYGDYIARHASLCSDCHTPRNLKTGEFYNDSLLAGSSIRFGDADKDPVSSFAPNITSDLETGIGKWTEDQFLLLLRTGIGPDGKVRTHHMPYAYYGIWDSLELKAIYQFIRNIKPVHRIVPSSEFVRDAISADPLIKGRGLFDSYCIACHGQEGKGALPTNVVLRDVSPSLSDSELTDFVMTGNPGLRMPGFGKTLSDDQLKAVVTYIRSWSSSGH